MSSGAGAYSLGPLSTRFRVELADDHAVAGADADGKCPQMVASTGLYVSAVTPTGILNAGARASGSPDRRRAPPGMRPRERGRPAS